VNLISAASYNTSTMGKSALGGRSDCSVWFDDKALGTNLIIVEAKEAGVI
jgi:hypothetical protein